MDIVAGALLSERKAGLAMKTQVENQEAAKEAHSKAHLEHARRSHHTKKSPSSDRASCHGWTGILVTSAASRL